MECKGACELESSHRAGDRAAMAAERAAAAQVDNLRSQRNLLAHSLGELLVALGRITSTSGMEVPDLLMLSQEATQILKGKESGCTGITATHCPVHGNCTCPKPTDTGYEPLTYLNSGGCPLHSPSSMHGV